MPEMDGVEATLLIREIGTDYAKNIPIIAFTANAIVGNEEMFLQQGFQAFISKPIDITRLDAVIREWIRDKEQEKLYNLSSKSEFYAPVKKYKIDWRALDNEIGLNAEKGIERFGGDENAYVDVLRSYVKNIPPLLETAQTVNKDHQAEYSVIVHGIKGASRGICAEKTAAMAEALELSSKGGDYEYVAAHNSSFIETARKLVSDIEIILTQIKPDNPKEKKSRPNKETLDRLRNACIQH